MEAEYETTESRWFRIVVFIVSGFFVGFSLANIIYFNRLRINGGVPGIITQGEATAMLWVNVILFVISVVIFVWSIYRLVVPPKAHKQVVTYFKQPPYYKATSTEVIENAQPARVVPQMPNYPPAVPVETNVGAAPRRRIVYQGRQ